MLIRELKRIIEKLPGDADIVLQKRTIESRHIFAEVLEHRISSIRDKKGKYYCRLVLINDKPLENTNEDIPC